VTGPPRDWDKEMAEIDKLIAKQPASPPSGQGSVVRGGPVALPAPQRAASPPVARGGREALVTWVKVLLGVGVAAAVGLAWPYAHVCGVPLYGYLAAAGGVVLVALWGMAASWRSRMPLAHTLALLATLAGVVLAGKVLLDRTDYPKQPATWSCGP
jgi:hypothetical protein